MALTFFEFLDHSAGNLGYPLALRLLPRGEVLCTGFKTGTHPNCHGGFTSA